MTTSDYEYKLIIKYSR